MVAIVPHLASLIQTKAITPDKVPHPRDRKPTSVSRSFLGPDAVGNP
jgi:hypothetical protein